MSRRSRADDGRALWCTVLALCLLAGASPLDAQYPQAIRRGRESTRLFYEDRVDSLWSQFAKPMRDLFTDVAGLEQARTGMLSQLGREVAMVFDTSSTIGTSTVYLRVATFSKVPGQHTMQWTFDSLGHVAGFVVGASTPPALAPSEHLAYRTKTVLHLPFSGEWFVLWGGRTLAQNYHATASDQRFAYDFLVMRDGRTHTGNGTRNEDYFCHGMPVIAPGAGVVRESVDSVSDNQPGTMNPRQPLGNHVVIDHGNGEYSISRIFFREV